MSLFEETRKKAQKRVSEARQALEDITSAEPSMFAVAAEKYREEMEKYTPKPVPKEEKAEKKKKVKPLPKQRMAMPAQKIKVPEDLPMRIERRIARNVGAGTKFTPAMKKTRVFSEEERTARAYAQRGLQFLQTGYAKEGFISGPASLSRRDPERLRKGGPARRLRRSPRI